MNFSPEVQRDLILADVKLLYIILASSGGLEPFTIYRRSRFSLKFFLERYARLLKLNLIVENLGVARLSVAGEINAKAALPRLVSIKKEWREAPPDFLRPKLLDDYYIPNVDLLSKKRFQPK
ncbi:hypothetical protein LOY49_10935 [Pseudomonas atacamensis]|jgi:hypothetical protein|uniref:hypothetical protein n=1 Tax=Pseudomonas TaxID=286 RepID=UPI00215FD134|nr:hypothetical protein [Pseudomonas atacamensis]UVK95816.1 hypothetical protein LOY49_10935 [Pseudomonas atacamensis]